MKQTLINSYLELKRKGSTKIYLGKEPISGRRLMSKDYEWYNGVNDYILVTFEIFVELNKEWVKSYSKNK